MVELQLQPELARDSGPGIAVGRSLLGFAIPDEAGDPVMRP